MEVCLRPRAARSASEAASASRQLSRRQQGRREGRHWRCDTAGSDLAMGGTKRGSTDAQSRCRDRCVLSVCLSSTVSAVVACAA